MDMEIRFPGGLVVESVYKGHVLRTDQPRAVGGGGSAPAPFDLFLAAIGTCAGIYALRFCQERGLSTAGLGVALDFTRDPAAGRISDMRIELKLPAEFPEKYHPAILRAIDQCAVKRHLEQPPRIETVAVPAGANLVLQE